MIRRVGFIGLGAMGVPMAWNLHRAGFELSVFNRSPAPLQAFREAGIVTADSPAALAKGVDAVVIMVADPPALEAVSSGTNGILSALRPGTLVANMGTVSHQATRRLGEAVAALGGRFVDAPVVGTVKPAEDGNLLVLAGADAQDLAAAEGLLRPLAKRVFHCGTVGQGTRMKLAFNLLLAGMVELLGEAFVLAERGGVDTGLLLEVIGDSSLGAPLFQARGTAMYEGSFAKQFPTKWMLKDLDLILQEGRCAGVPLPVTASVGELFSAACSQGHAEEDIAAVLQVIRRLAGSHR